MKQYSSHKVFNAIMHLKDWKVYKWIYRHPLLSIMILVAFAVIILYIFVNFIFKYVI